MARKPKQELKEVPEIALTNGGDDSLADSEEQAIKSGTSLDDLVVDSKKREHGRRESIRDLMVCVIKFFVILAAVLLAIGVCIWAWHLFTPANWHFLEPGQVDKVQSILFSGAISALVTGLGGNYFFNKDR